METKTTKKIKHKNKETNVYGTTTAVDISANETCSNNSNGNNKWIS